jgi:hypothetical protein
MKKMACIISITTVFIISLLMNSVVFGASGKVLQIETATNAYSHIMRPIDISGKEVVLTGNLGNDHGYSWGPGLTLYWDAANWVKVQLWYPDLVKAFACIDGKLGGDFPKDGYNFSGKWVEGKIILDTDTGKGSVLVKWENSDWLEFGTFESPTYAKMPETVIVGRGYGTGTNPYDAPYLRNSIPPPRSLGELGGSYYDDIILEVDGKVIFTEDFEDMTKVKANWELSNDPIIPIEVFTLVDKEKWEKAP